MSSSVNEDVPTCALQISERAQKLREAFSACYKQQPDFYIRVPGRVNLIGEHIDYCGYGVCPMALEQDILLAVAASSKDTLDLHNDDPAYEPFSCDLRNITIDTSTGAPKWYQYFLCGVKGVSEQLKPEDVQLKGFKVLLTSRIPQSAGLSSSSALVSSAALATAYINKFSLSKNKLASLCAESERYIGTQGGGMDQAIAFFGKEGCAQLIEFAPLRSQDVVLPAGAVFVIAHSMSELNKAATSHYNCRVIECRLAAQIVAKVQGIVDWPAIRKLGQTQQALGMSLPEIIGQVEKILTKELYTREDVAQMLAVTWDTILESSFTAENTKDMEVFKLRQRALHVFQEALRVQQFHETCQLDPSSTTNNNTDQLTTLGKLMSASHYSLRDLYECSHPQLDRLVDLSSELSLGARLTGAGWGGCIVALVKPENIPGYLAQLKEEYYKPLGVTSEEALAKLVFATGPNRGACIYKEQMCNFR